MQPNQPGRHSFESRTSYLNNKATRSVDEQRDIVQVQISLKVEAQVDKAAKKA